MEENSIKNFLTQYTVKASAPCRIDMGGTLDIRTFHYPLQAAEPCTVNMALNLRTEVTLEPFEPGMVKVSSLGFEPATFPAGESPYNHPLGLMFAVADTFSASGLHIRIRSASPPRSALGGSSVAAVALVAALSTVVEKTTRPTIGLHETAMTAHAVEEAVAGIPCGIQDQLAAAFGGANIWFWKSDTTGMGYNRHPLLESDGPDVFDRHFLVAYCGVPHESRDINGRWVQGFLAGENRQRWREIAGLTRRFATALKQRDWSTAVETMNKETDLRKDMTPDVLDEVGDALVTAARRKGCGARFTGAGGGGCLWALGAEKSVSKLRGAWDEILNERKDGRILVAGLDTTGLRVDCSTGE